MKGYIEDKALTSPTELWKHLYLKFIVTKRFQSLIILEKYPLLTLPKGLEILWQSSENCLQVCPVEIVL